MKTLFFIALLISGCATQSTQFVALVQKPGSCQITNASPNWLGTVTVTSCWGDDGKLTGQFVNNGTAIVQPIGEVIKASGYAGAIAGTLNNVPTVTTNSTIQLR